ncbi:MAG: hypothetical protein H6740_14260 [Alphaproteobacteria bacterium]|nr:hypothetical protein [Alphaproteobacteria bacterium]
MLALLLLSCAPKPPPPAEAGPPPAQEAPPPSASALELHMAGHQAMLTRARDAFAQGDTAGARASLDQLATHPNAEGLPEGWQARVAELRLAAVAARDAETPEATAAGLAHIATTCGDCHVAAGASLPPPAGVVPEDVGVTAHMMRHQWALERLWAGLTLPSDEAWTLGAAALAEGALPTLDLSEGSEEAGHESQALADAIHELGARAAAPDADRQALLGELLTTCADCHGLTRGAPAAP